MTPGGTTNSDSDNARLGLRPDAVEVVGSDPGWPAIYRGFEQQLAAACDGLSVEIAHIGSTSVPGLAAKPVIDVAVGARRPIQEDDFIARLATCGFDFVADLGIYGGLFFTASADGVVISNLHVVDIAGRQWRWYLAFRDALRTDAQLRHDYTALKRQAAENHHDDRPAYTKAKSDWLIETVSRIADG